MESHRSSPLRRQNRFAVVRAWNGAYVDDIVVRTSLRLERLLENQRLQELIMQRRKVYLLQVFVVLGGRLQAQRGSQHVSTGRTVFIASEHVGSAAVVDPLAP